MSQAHNCWKGIPSIAKALGQAYAWCVREWVAGQGGASELESGEGVENNRTRGQGLVWSGVVKLVAPHGNKAFSLTVRDQTSVFGRGVTCFILAAMYSLQCRVSDQQQRDPFCCCPSDR